MPKQWRVDKGIGFLGPAGAWWIKSRVQGQFPLRTGVEIRAASQEGSGIRLTLEGASGGVVHYDHVIAGTGYRLDTGRLAFLAPELRDALSIEGGAPVLSRGFESSVPGLFFIRAMAAPSLGPSTRFVSGTHFTARRLTNRLLYGRRSRAFAGVGDDRTGPIALQESA